MRNDSRPAPGLARPARHRRPVPVRPRPEEGLAHRHAAYAERAALEALRDAKPAFEKAWDAWDTAEKATADQAAAALGAYREARDAWVDVVLRTVLGWKNFYLTPASIDVKVARARLLRHHQRRPARSPVGDMTGALVLVIDPVESLRAPLDDGWAASPIDRMEELLRASGVRVGVVTDGRWWAIVCARPETMVASGITDSQRWIEVPVVRDAFIALLRLPRLVGNRTEDLLTDAVRGLRGRRRGDHRGPRHPGPPRRGAPRSGTVRESALDAQRRGEPDPLPARRDDVYQAAVTMMMRVVFLLFAEERGLLPQSQLFTGGYGISDELDTLDQRARDEGAEALDRTHLTWHRLLATSQALYRGASFEDIRIPSYGGSLFDPDRFSSSPPATTTTPSPSWSTTASCWKCCAPPRWPYCAASPPGASPSATSTWSRSATSTRACSATPAPTSMRPSSGSPGRRARSRRSRSHSLKNSRRGTASRTSSRTRSSTGRRPTSPPRSRRARPPSRKRSRVPSELEDAERALRAAVPADPGLRERLRPFVGAIRRDLRDRPTVFQPGGLVVVETPSRATAGAHYTPKSLATEVVQHALEPLVYRPGPHQEPDQKKWVPVDSDRILELKVADIACGSGAFLVAAARYLSARLVEAWQRQAILFHGLSSMASRWSVESRQAYHAQVARDPQDRPQRRARAGAFGSHRVLQARAREVSVGPGRPLADHRAQEAGRAARDLGKLRIRGLAVVFGVQLPRALTAAIIDNALRASEGIAGLSATMRV